jgi:hypothetical protein
MCGWKCLTGAGWQQNAWQQNNTNWLGWEQDSGWQSGDWNNWTYSNTNYNNVQNCQQLPPCYQGCNNNCQMTPCGPKCVGGIFNGGGNTVDAGLCMQACQQCSGGGWSCPQQLQQALGACFNQGFHCGGNNGYGYNGFNNTNNGIWF